MIKLKYDVKCGWNQLYIVEKDLEMDITNLVIPDDDIIAQIVSDDLEYVKPTEQEIYDSLKGLSDKQLLDTLINDFGIDYSIFSDREYYAHTYFKDYCKKENCLPGIFEMSNIDVLLVDNDPSSPNYVPPLRASEVMSILNITRQTLTSYVKRGLIKLESNPNGKQYRYNAKSVYSLLDGKKKH